MKVGIFTQPLHTNYGGLLQAFALQKVLNSEFDIDSTTVNIQFDTNNTVKFKNIIKNLFKKYILLKKGITVFPFKPTVAHKEIIAKHSNDFIFNHIKTTRKISRYDKDSLTKLRYDAYVVGSDQVWRPKYSPDIYTYFLDFLKNNKSVRKISYAASFGVDTWEFNKRQTFNCQSLAKEFDAISVREDSGIELCKKYLDVNAVKVLDPTMLVEINEYKEIMHNQDFGPIEDYIMFYVLDPELLKGALVQKIKEGLSINLNNFMPLPFTKENAKKIELCVYPPVGEWLSGFFNAKYVITDSFHGTVFSILFNKQFVALGNVERGMTRFNSLLKMFGLENRLVTSIEQIEKGILEKKIDYDKVNEILKAEKGKSMGFLKNALFA